MPWPSNHVPKYRKHRASGQAIVNIAGKDHYLKAADFGPKSLKAIRHSWLLSGQDRKTINQNARRLKSIFRWAASEELAPVAIHQALATVAGLKKGRTEAPENLPVLPVELRIKPTSSSWLV